MSGRILFLVFVTSPCILIPACTNDHPNVDSGQDVVSDSPPSDGCPPDDGGLFCPLRCDGKGWCGVGGPRQSYCLNETKGGPTRYEPLPTNCDAATMCECLLAMCSANQKSCYEEFVGCYQLVCKD